MFRQFIIFIKIMLILIIFTMLLPYLLDSLVNMIMIEDHPQSPKGNSTFVSSQQEEEGCILLHNLSNLSKYFLY